MKAEIEYEDPKPKGVTLHLSKQEAVDLLALTHIKGVWSLTRDIGFKTFDIDGNTKDLQRLLSCVAPYTEASD